jgi:hypothetical protein
LCIFPKGDSFLAEIAVQYLENVPGVLDIPPRDVRAKLRAAFERLPITAVLLGWNLTEPFIRVCREETTRAGAQLYLWHPLLTGDGRFYPRPEWRTLGLRGEPVPGFVDMAEFTFVCPNRSAVREAALDHLRSVIAPGDFDGVFLDRIRLPSPAADPSRWLACFCDDCRHAAAAYGLNLKTVRRAIGRLLENPERVAAFLGAILGSGKIDSADRDVAQLGAFLDFRDQSVTAFVRAAADLIHEQGLAVGLDCFSPALTRMVGQDLSALGALGEWTKVMVYGHTLGPAGLPFELLELSSWLIEAYSVTESQALEWLSRATGLELPPSCRMLRARGLAPAALRIETARGPAVEIQKLFAGIELVEIKDVAQLDLAQIENDLNAYKSAGVDGLVLSWDLWHIPGERLEIVRTVWAN